MTCKATEKKLAEAKQLIANFANEAQKRGLIDMSAVPGFATPTLLMGGAQPKVLSYVDAAHLSSSTASPSLTGISFGAEASDRRIIVAVAGEASNRTLTGGTIGGVTADVVFAQTGNTQRSTGILIAHVPTGTSGTVALTWNDTNAAHTIIVFRATGLASNTKLDANGSTVDPSSIALTTGAGGFVIMVASANGTGGQTWTNISNTVYSAAPAGRVLCGYELTTGSSLTVGNDWSGSNTARSACAASW